METILDELGRILLPKEIREDFGLEPGAVLRIEEREGEILLRPAKISGLVRKEGVLVFVGEAEEDMTDAVQKNREERTKKISGMG